MLVGAKFLPVFSGFLHHQQNLFTIISLNLVLTYYILKLHTKLTNRVWFHTMYQTKRKKERKKGWCCQDIKSI